MRAFSSVSNFCRQRGPLCCSVYSLINNEEQPVASTNPCDKCSWAAQCLWGVWRMVLWGFLLSCFFSVRLWHGLVRLVKVESMLCFCMFHMWMCFVICCIYTVYLTCVFFFNPLLKDILKTQLKQCKFCNLNYWPGVLGRPPWIMCVSVEL